MPAPSGFRPEPLLVCELMFETKKSLASRLGDALDLVIDFATLGEYGLEPAEEWRRCDDGRRRRPASAGLAPVDRTDHLPARL